MMLNHDLSPYSDVNVPLRNNLESTVDLQQGLITWSAHESPNLFSSHDADFAVITIEIVIRHDTEVGNSFTDDSSTFKELVIILTGPYPKDVSHRYSFKVW